jgi:DNA-binding SARP family transcriptional activator/TolB-like protein/Tfp pilus assembly protein PilF
MATGIESYKMRKAARERNFASSSLKIHLFGQFRVAVNGLPVEEYAWGRRKPKLLVKLLALQPHHQLHREQALELLWPDSDPKSAINNLHKAIHMARHALEPALESAADSHFIITRSPQIVLCAADRLWIDVEAFEGAAAEALKSSDAQAYEKALRLYEGDLLIEDPYEDWAASRREHLRGLRHDLLWKLSRLYESRGEHEHSINRLREMFECDPTDEEVHRGLMRLYALTGNRHQAIKQYQQCAEIIRRELEAEPDRATVELYRQIESGRIKPLAGGRVTLHHPAPDKRALESIAILPLANLTLDANMEYLSDGITENIINRLSQLPGLRVMAWGTVARYKGLNRTPDEIGRDLNVRAVMMGRVLELGEKLVVKIELIDSADGSQLWGEQYDGRRADVFAVQEEIAREISEKLRLKLTGEEKRRLTERQTENIEAYHAYLKGRYYWNKRATEWLKKGVEHFRQAIDLDPGYALAYTGLSDSYTLLVVREALLPEEGFAKAKAAAARALKISERLAEAHASLGHAMLHNWEWAQSETEFTRAIGLNPGYPSAHHWYSEYLTAMGRCDESIVELKLAAALDPLSLIINADLGRAFYYARRYDEVIKQEAKTLEMDPNFWLSHINLGRSYTQAGLHAEAIGELQKAREVSPGNTEVLAFLGFAYAAAGDSHDALKVLEYLNEQSKRMYVPPYHFAIVDAGLGRKNQAFSWLEQAFERHAVDLFTLKVEPMFDSLRSDPRFTDLLRRVRLAP